MGASCTRVARGPGIVLVILDTVRADHLGVYGYARDTSPHLDRLAAEGERFEEAYSQAPWTLPAVATILTGQPPHVHGASRGQRGLHPIRPETPTLAERLRGSGYRTAAIVNVVFCSSESGLDRGFERFDYQGSDATNVGTRNAEATTDAALDWLRGLKRGEPFFLVVHYFDAHLTYDPPPPYDTLYEPDATGRIATGFGSFRQVRQIADGTLRLTDRQKESLRARYDGEIRYVDEQFGRLRRGLEDLALWDRSLVLVVSDHGEELWDHGGFEHGHTHYRELIRIPLILRRPGAPSGLVHEERVRQTDIAPTVLEFAFPERAPDLPGKVLGGGGARFSVAEGSLWAGDLASVRAQGGTLIRNRSTGTWEFFGAEDPGETRNLWSADLPAAGELAEVLNALPPSRIGEPGGWTPSQEQIERLRSLGYIR